MNMIVVVEGQLWVRNTMAEVKKLGGWRWIGGGLEGREWVMVDSSVDQSLVEL
jgi:hypothetical protein